MKGICHIMMLVAQTAWREDVAGAEREPKVSPALLGLWTDSQTVLGRSNGHWPDTDPTLRLVQPWAERLESPGIQALEETINDNSNTKIGNWYPGLTSRIQEQVSWKASKSCSWLFRMMSFTPSNSDGQQPHEKTLGDMEMGVGQEELQAKMRTDDYTSSHTANQQAVTLTKKQRKTAAATDSPTARQTLQTDRQRDSQPGRWDCVCSWPRDA